MPDDPTFNRPGWQAQNIYNVAGNLNQGASRNVEQPSGKVVGGFQSAGSSFPEDQAVPL
jgi:hypothetical protein